MLTEADFEDGQAVQYRTATGSIRAGYTDFSYGAEVEGYIRVMEADDFGDQFYVPAENIILVPTSRK